MTAEQERPGTEVPQSPRLPARLLPFRALRLAPERVADLATLRPMSRPYRQAARRLLTWEAEGRLARDDEPALHLHEYTASGITVRGVVGSLDLSTRADSLQDRAVLPHEAIHPEQADELAHRMEDLALNPAPILLVHRGTAESRLLLDRIASAAPDHAFTDHAGQDHRQWRIDDPATQAALTAALGATPLLVADGHHRYAAYLRLQEQHPGTGWDRGLAMVVDQEDTPLFLGAIHRVFRGLTCDELVAAVRETGGSASRTSRDRAIAALSPSTWAITDGHDWLTVTPACGEATAVEHLHVRLLPRVLAATPGLSHQLAVSYRHGSDEAEAEALEPDAVAVILPSPTFREVEEASLQGRLLPEKATSFQPKPSLGVYMRAVRAG
ncbi:DUF1015 family protein [Nocardioides solisilvae]|uniref:DUF1015 family protein n=1 Tax=Nocardioides solisilvae TaxID=1542435 RepID=UPI0013A56FB6|nr:DUF1015 family protein [Nocardioides solisilvae]